MSAEFDHGVFYLPAERGARIDVTVDCSRCENSRQILTVLGQSLAFPAWYGANFDALFDCLSDPDGQPTPGPMRVALTGLRPFRTAAPDQFAVLVGVLGDACLARHDAGASLVVLVDLPTPGLPTWPAE